MKVIVGTVVAAFALAGAAVAASGWHVVKAATVSGAFAVKSISATVQHPKAKGIAVRFTGSLASGNAVVSCTKGTGVAAWSKTYAKAGTYVLPMTAGADSCEVVAAVGGAGRLTVQVLRR